jgi:penicillin-binding protein A
MNRQIRRLALGLLACYVVLFVQLNILQVKETERFTSDPRNGREVVKSFNKPRGRIITADGVIIAESVPVDGKFEFRRRYPLGDLFTHVTGYYTLGFGATQLERTYNDVLAGTTPAQQLSGIGGILTGEEDTSGDVHITLRSDLQAEAKAALGDREGTVVALDPRTGAVLAMYSNPTFDANLVTIPDSGKAGDVLTFLEEVPGKPLLANAYQERYMPGSTFKVITTSIALHEGITTTERVFEVEKEFTPPQTDDPIENYGGRECGGTMVDVFRRSCNTPFARMTVELGPGKFIEGVRGFGLVDEAVPADHLGLPRPAKSTIGPLDDIDQNLPLLAFRGFGQGEDQITPLQMAMVAATVANGGQMMAPYVVDRAMSRGGRQLSSTSPKVWKRPMAPEVAATLTDLMIRVVADGTATATMQLANGIQAAAKTGTAQLNKKGEPARSHAWIIAFAPAEQPRIAVAVMLKGTTAEISTGTGGTLAGPIAKRVLDLALAVPE